MTLKPWPEACKAAARALRAGRIARDSMQPREAAEAAYSPGGPSVDALEALIRRHRAEARAALASREAEQGYADRQPKGHDARKEDDHEKGSCKPTRRQVNQPRSSAEMKEEFPYTLSTMCYIEVGSDGDVLWGVGREAYERARRGECRLYAVWPGQWSSHLFAIDDLDQYAAAFGLVHDEKRTGLTDHQHEVSWSVSPYEKRPNGSYISIEVRFGCGCSIRDIKAFAKQMREQKGWHIATTTGWGSVGETYSIRVRRKSLQR